MGECEWDFSGVERHGGGLTVKKGWLWLLIILLAAYGAYLTYLTFFVSEGEVSTNYLFFNVTPEFKQTKIFSNAVLSCYQKNSTFCDFGGNIVFEQAYGRSMYPTLIDSDFILCSPFTDSDVLVEGKIYSVRNLNGEPVGTHRCVYSPDFGQSCVFKGDGNLLRDGLIQRADVLAKCNWVVRFVG